MGIAWFISRIGGNFSGTPDMMSLYLSSHPCRSRGIASSVNIGVPFGTADAPFGEYDPIVASAGVALPGAWARAESRSLDVSGRADGFTGSHSCFGVLCLRT
jgi:hypothetical protein